MNNTCSIKLLLFLTTTFFLSGCQDDVLGVPNGSSTGVTGVDTGVDTGATAYSNVVLKSHFSKTIALVDGSGNGGITIDELHVGNKDDSPIIILGGSTFKPNNYFVYRADSVGQTELHAVSTPYSNSTAISGDGTAVVHATTGGRIDIIDPVTRASQQIGSSLNFFITGNVQISDDASIVAFISDKDLTGNNSGNVRQIFTLSTDGNDIIRQVTNFTDWDISTIALSGDGSIIFFDNHNDLMKNGSNADGSLELFSINTDGANLEQITNNIVTEGFFTEIKSDQLGATAAFVIKNNDGDHNLYTTNVSTGNSVFISNTGSSGGGLISGRYDISSDGSTIFYVTENNGICIIFSINSNGTNIQEALGTYGSILYPHSSSTGVSVTFLSDGYFEKAIADDESFTQVYTLTP